MDSGSWRAPSASRRNSPLGFVALSIRSTGIGRQNFKAQHRGVGAQPQRDEMGAGGEAPFRTAAWRFLRLGPWWQREFSPGPAVDF